MLREAGLDDLSAVRSLHCRLHTDDLADRGRGVGKRLMASTHALSRALGLSADARTGFIARRPR